MANSMGESIDGSLWLDFERRLKLEFHGSSHAMKRPPIELVDQRDRL